MKTVKNKSIKILSKELEESWRIEQKLLKTTNRLTDEEVKFIKSKAEEGCPLDEFLYGLYFLLSENNEKQAEEWWNKSFYHCNGFCLWRMSGIFAYLGDEYYEWSMKCLKKSAWRQFPIAKEMVKRFKKQPFKFPVC